MIAETSVETVTIAQETLETSTDPILNPVTVGPALTSCAMGAVLPSLNSTFIRYNKGSWAQEATGRWMKGQQADLILSLPYELADTQSNQYSLRL